jgi:hypothetical protein
MNRFTALVFGLSAYVLLFLPFFYPLAVLARPFDTCPTTQALLAAATTPCGQAPDQASHWSGT